MLSDRTCRGSEVVWLLHKIEFSLLPYPPVFDARFAPKLSIISGGVAFTWVCVLLFIPVVVVDSPQKTVGFFFLGGGGVRPTHGWIRFPLFGAAGFSLYCLPLWFILRYKVAALIHRVDAQYLNYNAATSQVSTDIHGLCKAIAESQKKIQGQYTAVSTRGNIAFA